MVEPWARGGQGRCAIDPIALPGGKESRQEVVPFELMLEISHTKTRCRARRVHWKIFHPLIIIFIFARKRPPARSSASRMSGLSPRSARWEGGCQSSDPAADEDRVVMVVH